MPPHPLSTHLWGFHAAGATNGCLTRWIFLRYSHVECGMLEWYWKLLRPVFGLLWTSADVRRRILKRKVQLFFSLDDHMHSFLIGNDRRLQSQCKNNPNALLFIGVKLAFFTFFCLVRWIKQNDWIYHAVIRCLLMDGQSRVTFWLRDCKWAFMKMSKRLKSDVLHVYVHFLIMNNISTFILPACNMVFMVILPSNPVC